MNRLQVCPICGKKYYPAAYHIYHDTKKRLVCSWGCMRKSEKERKDTRGA